MKQNVVALFDNYDLAARALGGLVEKGARSEQVSIIAADPWGGDHPREADSPSRVAEPAGVAGSGLALNSLVIPGVGAVLGAGPILRTLASAGGGLVAGALTVALERLGLSEDEAKRYTNGVKSGGAVVAVTSDAREVVERLREAGPAQVIEHTAARNQPLPHDAGDLEKTALGPAQSAPENPDFDSSFDEFAGVLARDESVLLGERRGPQYERDREAYSFGYRMATAKGYARRGWVDAETDLRSAWEQQGGTDWDHFQPEIQRGWMIARGLG